MHDYMHIYIYTWIILWIHYRYASGLIYNKQTAEGNPNLYVRFGTGNSFQNGPTNLDIQTPQGNGIQRRWRAWAIVRLLSGMSRCCVLDHFRARFGALFWVSKRWMELWFETPLMFTCKMTYNNYYQSISRLPVFGWDQLKKKWAHSRHHCKK